MKKNQLTQFFLDAVFFPVTNQHMDAKAFLIYATTTKNILPKKFFRVFEGAILAYLDTLKFFWKTILLLFCHLHEKMLFQPFVGLLLDKTNML